MYWCCAFHSYVTEQRGKEGGDHLTSLFLWENFVGLLIFNISNILLGILPGLAIYKCD